MRSKQASSPFFHERIPFLFADISTKEGIILLNILSDLDIKHRYTTLNQSTESERNNEERRESGGKRKSAFINNR